METTETTNYKNTMYLYLYIGLQVKKFGVFSNIYRYNNIQV